MVSEGYVITIICLALNCLAFALYVASTIFSHWGISTGPDQIPTNLGLWHLCFPRWSKIECRSTTDWCSMAVSSDTTICTKLKTTQAFMLIACITSGLTILPFVACVFIKKDWCRILVRINSVLLFIAVLAGLVAGLIGIIYVKNAHFELDTSVVLEIVAIVINLICLASAVEIPSLL